MTNTNRERLQLGLAIGVLLACVALVWMADTARAEQFRILDGCWPATTKLNDETMSTEVFWGQLIEKMNLGTVALFFHTRTRHRIMLYIIVLCAMIGWSGSILRRIVTTRHAKNPRSRQSPEWEEVIASFFLAGLGGGVVFAIFISARLTIDSSGLNCVPETFQYLSAVAGIAAGMFVVRFFDWFETRSKGFLTRVSGSSQHEG